jgi:hypothetical protein
MLNGPRYVSAAQQPSKDVQRFSSGFNMHVYKAAQHKGDMKFVASPVIGGGIFIPQSQQLFLLATKQGIKDPAEQAKFVMRTPAFHNTRLTREGKRLESAEENLAEWTRRAAEFGNKRLPMLSALGLI